ncbi:hypothetical protein GCM10023238_38620 [Streptomyces heliomycini]
MQALYSKDLWKFLTDGLEQAYAGDGTILMALSDANDGRSENGGYSNLIPANVAVNCSDDKSRHTPEDVERGLPAFRAASPLFGEYLAWGMVGCTDWAVPGAAEHPDVHAPGAAPILVIATPATRPPRTRERAAWRGRSARA